MKKWLTGFSMCWGMFCAIPNPVRRWDEGCYRQMLLCLPFFGGMLGLIWAGIGFLLVRISAPGPVFALCMTAAPWCLTGFIHLDGFMDCSDAVLSRRDRARRIEILKDPHVGSFAVICLVLLTLTGYSVWSCPVESGKLWALPLLLLQIAEAAPGGIISVFIKGQVLRLQMKPLPGVIQLALIGSADNQIHGFSSFTAAAPRCLPALPG